MFEQGMLDIKCKYCTSENVVKNGKTAGKQGFLCKACGHKFTNNRALIGMRTPVQMIGTSLHLFYTGYTTKEVQERLMKEHDFQVSHSAIWRWVMRFSPQTYDYLSHHPLNISETWFVHNSEFGSNGRMMVCSDIIDLGTGYLLFSGLSEKKRNLDITHLFRQCKTRSIERPRRIIAKPRFINQRGIDLIFSEDRDTGHGAPVIIEYSAEKHATGVLQMFSAGIRSRRMILGRLNGMANAQNILDGYNTQYNHFQSAVLSNWTPPAWRAGFPVRFDDWYHLLLSMEG